MEIELANWLEEFLTAYGIFPYEYRGERYIHAQDFSPNVFGSLVDEEEHCFKFEEHTSLRVDRYSDSIYQDKTPAQLHAVNQLVTKQQEYRAMLDSIEQEIPVPKS